MEEITISVHMLEEADSPDNDAARVLLHVHDEEMAVAEPLNQWRTVTEACEPAFGVDVEDKEAAIIEVLVSAIEDLLPLRELQEVVDRVIDAEHDVKSLAQGEPRHIGFDQANAWQFLGRDFEHRRGQIEPGDPVLGLQLLEDRARAAREFENRPSGGVMPVDQLA